MDSVRFPARVFPFGRGFILVMAEDGTATRRIDAAQRDFVASVSCELKTLTGVMGTFIETIEAVSENPRQVTHLARCLRRESTRPAEFAGQIVELPRLQSSDLMLNHEVVDVEETVDEAIGRIRETAEVRRINLVRAAVPYARVLGGRRQLIDVVVNFARNAISHPDDNTRVAVTTAQVWDKGDDHVEIAVTDNGIGISQEDQGRIFGHFYQVDHGRFRESGGTGLGLSIVRHIALAHKRSVRVWSRLRRGSTFISRPPTRQDGIVDGETRKE